MIAGEWIALSTLLLIYGTAIISFWIKIKVKIKELDIKINNQEERLNDYVKDCSIITLNNKEDHKEIMVKMDVLLQSFNNFRVYVERKFNGQS